MSKENNKQKRNLIIYYENAEMAEAFLSRVWFRREGTISYRKDLFRPKYLETIAHIGAVASIVVFFH